MELKHMLLSVVIPAYNEAEGLERFHTQHLLPAIKSSSADTYEILYINDGSTDETLSILNQLAAHSPTVKVINLSRNFGKEIATTAGIHQAKGDAIIILDSDGQHPPEIFPEFLKLWRSGAQVVIGVRNSNTDEGIIKRYGSKLFYRLFNTFSENTIVPRSTDYRLIDKVVQEEFIRFDERQRLTRGLIDWLGFDREYVYFDSPARLAGEASYSTRKLIKLAVNSFISLSLTPLFIFGWIGVVITSLSLIVGTFIVFEQFVFGDPFKLAFTGSALLGIFVSFLVGMVLISQGIIAMYLSHVHHQSQGRPLFVVNKKGSRNLDK